MSLDGGADRDLRVADFDAARDECRPRQRGPCWPPVGWKTGGAGRCLLQRLAAGLILATSPGSGIPSTAAIVLMGGPVATL